MSKMGESFESDQYVDQLEGLIKYREAYDIFMEYFNYLNQEDRKDLDKKLNKLGL